MSGDKNRDSRNSMRLLFFSIALPCAILGCAERRSLEQEGKHPQETSVAGNSSPSRIPDSQMASVLAAAGRDELSAIRRLQDHYFLASDNPQDGLKWLQRGAELGDFVSTVDLATNVSTSSIGADCMRGAQLLASAKEMVDSPARERMYLNAVEMLAKQCPPRKP